MFSFALLAATAVSEDWLRKNPATFIVSAIATIVSALATYRYNLLGASLSNYLFVAAACCTLLNAASMVILASLPGIPEGVQAQNTNEFSIAPIPEARRRAYIAPDLLEQVDENLGGKRMTKADQPTTKHEEAFA